MNVRKSMRTLLTAAFAIAAALALAGCSGQASSQAASSAAADASAGSASASAASPAASETASLGIAYQYGLSYAPVVIAKEQGLIEAKYKEATGNDLAIEWNQMSSGPDINTGITSGSIDVGFMGLAPAITGITTGLDYKIFANISGQEHSLITSDPDLKSIGDLVGSDKQIALVNIGSFQHLLLAKALADNGFDAHALDANIVAMKHPDGMAALQSGSIPVHLTSSPYTFTERADGSLHELPEVNECWTKDDSFIVGVASSSLRENDELYSALVDGIAEAQQFITDNPEEAAQILCEFDGNTPEQELEYLTQGTYSPTTNKLFELATFMADNGFIDNAPAAYEDLVFDNVTGN